MCFSVATKMSLVINNCNLKLSVIARARHFMASFCALVYYYFIVYFIPRSFCEKKTLHC